MRKALQITIPGRLDARLSPNARLHWRTLDRAKKATKAIVSIYTRQALLGVDITGIERATYDVELGLARGEKTKDPDNLGASLKYHIDAIAYECLVDDRHWETGARTQVRDPEGVGYLTIRLTWEAA